MCNEDAYQLQDSILDRGSFFPCPCKPYLPKSPHGQRDLKRSCASGDVGTWQCQAPALSQPGLLPLMAFPTSKAQGE